ncbi:hypothetical protein Ais01nite_48620 [Asanoa ishikariensis]|nr:hypothetical protein Ais01nite_48620 [Asanoa ishikariensis]
MGQGPFPWDGGKGPHIAGAMPIRHRARVALFSRLCSRIKKGADAPTSAPSCPPLRVVARGSTDSAEFNAR